MFLDVFNKKTPAIILKNYRYEKKIKIDNSKFIKNNMEVQENLSTLGFQEYMVDIINKGSLSLMLSIGHRVGLFDTMVSLPPSKSKQQIAIASNLNERYT
jgi:hypothetical protein